ncbi:bacteriohemerythrin [Candidatus Riflebacteria bacterium]
MSLVELESVLKVGIKTIDADHAQLFTILNKLYDAYQAELERAILEDTVNELSHYTIYHFSNEEKILKENGYPRLEEHLNQHQFFTEKIQDFRKTIKKGNTRIGLDVLAFIKDWLLGHIQKSDRDYSEYFKKMGIIIR